MGLEKILIARLLLMSILGTYIEHPGNPRSEKSKKLVPRNCCKNKKGGNNHSTCFLSKQIQFAGLRQTGSPQASESLRILNSRLCLAKTFAACHNFEEKSREQIDSYHLLGKLETSNTFSERTGQIQPHRMNV